MAAARRRLEALEELEEQEQEVREPEVGPPRLLPGQVPEEGEAPREDGAAAAEGATGGAAMAAAAGSWGGEEAAVAMHDGADGGERETLLGPEGGLGESARESEHDLEDVARAGQAPGRLNASVLQRMKGGVHRVAPAPASAPGVKELASGAAEELAAVPAGDGAGGVGAVRAYRRRVKKVRRVIDLFTYSPYFSTRVRFGRVRALAAVYLWAALFSSIPLWGRAHQYMRGNYPCVGTQHSVTVFMTHPTFWNLLAGAIKMTLGAYLCLGKRLPRLRVWYSVLEHVALPSTVTYAVYFWGANTELESSLGLGLALNNHVVVPLVLVGEAWASKTPFYIERLWEIVVFLVWQVVFVLVFSAASEGCYLIPALNPHRNVVWIAYPGLFLLYVAGFFTCYTFTQFRDHVAPCGQRVFPPRKATGLRSGAGLSVS